MPHTMLRFPTVKARTGLSRSTTYLRISRGTFPAPSARNTEAPEPDPLTASFSDVPAEHSEESFTFGLTFSEEPDVSYQTLRDEAFEVNGGTVRKAKRREQGSNLGWTITVEPDSRAAVTITLPSTTDCGASGAICTDDDRPLSNSPSTTVAGPPSDPLTASFSGVPGEHTGERFTFGLTFSEDVAGLSFKTVRDAAFAVTGGDVRKAQRTQQGSNQGWTITVEPSGNGAVSIRLPAGSVETSDGRGLERSVSATVNGPAEIVVADARVDENPNAALAFAVNARPRRERHGDGGLRHIERHGHGGRGLHRHERHAPLRGGRAVEERLGRGA